MGDDLKQFFGLPDAPGPILIVVPGVSRKRKGSLECRNYPLYPFEVSPDDMLSSASALALLSFWYGSSVRLELERTLLYLPVGQHRVLVGGPPTNRFVAEANRHFQIRFDENPERRVLHAFDNRRYEVAVSGNERKAFVERDYCLVSRRVADNKAVEVSVGGLRAYGQVASQFFLGSADFYKALHPDPRSDCFQAVVEVTVREDRNILGWQVVEELSKVGATVRGRFLTQGGWQTYKSPAKAPVSRAPRDIFVSYSHTDQVRFEHLTQRAAALGSVRVWSDHDVPPGAEWRKKVNRLLDDAGVILLLVSNNYLDSVECELETKRALRRRDAGRAVVVPIIMSPCDWQSTPLGILQALPFGRSVEEWGDENAAFDHIVEKLKGL